tara:strand:+ start:352 stop:1173 length:822 start_codon:yes stop_codon:yes gene_type:complete
MKLESKNVPFSRCDLTKQISFPARLNRNLAELMGIIVGDGHLSIQKNRPGSARKYVHYQVIIAGSLSEDSDYFLETVAPLFRKEFNLELIMRKYPSSNHFTGVRDSKAVVNFLHLVLLIPIGNKSGIVSIPEIILKAPNSIQSSFIRGVADTDFCITFKKAGRKAHTYPVIKAKFKSFSLVDQLSVLLRSLGFTCSTSPESYYDARYEKIFQGKLIQLSGKANLEKWMKFIGFNNPRHLSKYQIWAKFGFCPPNTSLNQRKRILSGEVDPLTL